MADIKEKFGTNGVAITITVASLANNSARQSTVIDNSTNVYLDALVQLKIKTNASGTATTGYVNIYAFGTVDGGTTYTENAGATDAAITLTSPPNAVLIGRINCVANATTYYSIPMSVAAAFGGVLPEKWGIIVENKTGAALDSTAGNHAVKYQGVLNQSV